MEPLICIDCRRDVTDEDHERLTPRRVMCRACYEFAVATSEAERVICPACPDPKELHRRIEVVRDRLGLRRHAGNTRGDRTPPNTLLGEPRHVARRGGRQMRSSQSMEGT